MGVRSFRKIYKKLMGPVFTTVRPESSNEKYWPKEWQEDNIWYKQRTPKRVRLGRAVILGALHVSGVDWVTEEFAQYDAEMTADEFKHKLLDVSPTGRLVIITYFWIRRDVSSIELWKMWIETNPGVSELIGLPVQPRPPRRGGVNSNG